MTATATGRVVAAAGAGLTTLLLTLAPSALVVAIITIGALGEIEYSRLGPVAVLLFVAIAVATGYLVYRGLERVWSEPGRRPADVWIAYLVALTILLVGVIIIPVAVVFVTVDSDHGLSDRALLVDALWLAGHLGFAALAWVAARRLAQVERPAGDGG